MSIFRKIFGSTEDSIKESNENELNEYYGTNPLIPIDERFTFNFKKNGGKFLYCENYSELTEQFENILEENDWFESNALCLEERFFKLLNENKIDYRISAKPNFILTSCEFLIADEGSILFTSNQIKQYKPFELPDNIILIASTSQIILNKSESLQQIKKRYNTNYPTNITTFKYFEKTKEENFLNYGSAQKNLYLLLLEDL